MANLGFVAAVKAIALTSAGLFAGMSSTRHLVDG